MPETFRLRMPRAGLAHLLVFLPPACLTVLPLASLAGPETSLVARLLVVGALALAALRPGEALLVCAGLAPLAGPLGFLIGMPVGLAEALVLAFLGGWLIHEGMRRPRPDPIRQTMVIPAVLFALVVAASCVVQVTALQPSTDHTWTILREAGAFLATGYFPDHRRFPSITAGALLLEGTALYVSVVTLCRRDALLGQRLARMAVACATGVAGLSLNRLLAVSLQSGRPLGELAAGADPVRIGSAFGDINAVGSYLAMAISLSGALAVTERRMRFGWIIPACLMLGAMWLTGSRAALASVPLAAVGMLAMTMSARGRSRIRPALVAAALVLVALVTVRLFDTSFRPLSGAVNVRVELVRAGFKMFASHPFFGVGVGRFQPLTVEFAKPELLELTGPENAHNNFLQILAELGLVGLGAFTWLLLSVGRRMWGVHRAAGLSPLALGTASGVVAFLLTCVSGHPLLIPQVAYAFWLVLGLAVGLVQDPSPAVSAERASRRWPLPTIVAGAVAVLVALSVPVRARQMIAEANVGSATVGLSDWQTDSEGVSFRWMDQYAQFSIRANARVVGLPLRLSARQGGAPRAVEISVDGLLLARVELEGSEWHEFRVAMPPAPLGVDFRRIELRASRDEAATEGPAGTSGPPRIQIGRPILTRPTR